MLYDAELKEKMLDVLENGTPNIVDSIQHLMDEGFVPNHRKWFKLSMCSIMFDAIENIDVFTKEQQENLERIYNKVLLL